MSLIIAIKRLNHAKLLKTAVRRGQRFSPACFNVNVKIIPIATSPAISVLFQYTPVSIEQRLVIKPVLFTAELQVYHYEVSP